MILVDEWGHMVSDKNWYELHAFAKRIGLKRKWFQDHPYHPHYDLTTIRAVRRAIRAGAKMVKNSELFKRMLQAGLWETVVSDKQLKEAGIVLK